MKKKLTISGIALALLAIPQAASAETLDLRFADQVVLRGTSSPKGAADATEQHSGAAPSGPAASGGRGGPKQGG
jgi:hypothetical protein